MLAGMLLMVPFACILEPQKVNGDVVETAGLRRFGANSRSLNDVKICLI
jgi:hypothetical protein